MFTEQGLQIFVVVISLAFAAYWILSLGKLVWFDPDRFEKIMSERARHHPLNAYNPKYNWKAIISMYRVFSLVGALAFLALAIELLLGVLGIIK